MGKKRTIFLTGATGLVGSHLLKILLQNGHKVFCLARSKKDKSAKERVEEVLKFWDEKVLTENVNDLVVLAGDITKKNLGLNKEAIDLLKNEIEEVFHCAAVTDVNWPLEKIREVNVEGTRKVLDLSADWAQGGRLKKVNHISTAYVCGDYEGVFNEDDLDVGQKFDTTYEQSKFEAEKVVGEYRGKGLWVDIFRPSLIVGDSQTGKTFQFKHIYQFFSLCGLKIFDSVPLLDSRINLVPINFVSSALSTISFHGRCENRNYHLVSDKFVSVKDTIDIAGKLMGFRPPNLVTLGEFDSSLLTPAQRMILRNGIFSVNFRVRLDAHFINEFLKRYSFFIPEFENELLLRKVIKYFVHNK